MTSALLLTTGISVAMAEPGNGPLDPGTSGPPSASQPSTTPAPEPTHTVGPPDIMPGPGGSEPGKPDTGKPGTAERTESKLTDADYVAARMSGNTTWSPLNSDGSKWVTRTSADKADIIRNTLMSGQLVGYTVNMTAQKDDATGGSFNTSQTVKFGNEFTGKLLTPVLGKQINGDQPWFTKARVYAKKIGTRDEGLSLDKLKEHRKQAGVDDEAALKHVKELSNKFKADTSDMVANGRDVTDLFNIRLVDDGSSSNRFEVTAVKDKFESLFNDANDVYQLTVVLPYVADTAVYKLTTEQLYDIAPAVKRFSAVADDGMNKTRQFYESFTSCDVNSYSSAANKSTGAVTIDGKTIETGDNSLNPAPCVFVRGSGQLQNAGSSAMVKATDIVSGTELSVKNSAEVNVKQLKSLMYPGLTKLRFSMSASGCAAMQAENDAVYNNKPAMSLGCSGPAVWPVPDGHQAAQLKTLSSFVTHSSVPLMSTTSETVKPEMTVARLLELAGGADKYPVEMASRINIINDGRKDIEQYNDIVNMSIDSRSAHGLNCSKQLQTSGGKAFDSSVCSAVGSSDKYGRVMQGTENRVSDVYFRYTQAADPITASSLLDKVFTDKHVKHDQVVYQGDQVFMVGDIDTSLLTSKPKQLTIPVVKQNGTAVTPLSYSTAVSQLKTSGVVNSPLKPELNDSKPLTYDLTFTKPGTGYSFDGGKLSDLAKNIIVTDETGKQVDSSIFNVKADETKQSVTVSLNMTDNMLNKRYQVAVPLKVSDNAACGSAQQALSSVVATRNGVKAIDKSPKGNLATTVKCLKPSVDIVKTIGGKSLDKSTIKRNQTFLYKIDSSIPDSNRVVMQPNNWSVTTMLDTAYDQFTGRWSVYAREPFTLDGVQVKAGDRVAGTDMKQLFEQPLFVMTKNDNGEVTVKATEWAKRKLLTTDSPLAWSTYIQVERVRNTLDDQTVSVKFTETYNKAEGLSNTVFTGSLAGKPAVEIKVFDTASGEEKGDRNAKNQALKLKAGKPDTELTYRITNNGNKPLGRLDLNAKVLQGHGSLDALKLPANWDTLVLQPGESVTVTGDVKDIHELHESEGLVTAVPVMPCVDDEWSDPFKRAPSADDTKDKLVNTDTDKPVDKAKAKGDKLAEQAETDTPVRQCYNVKQTVTASDNWYGQGEPIVDQTTLLARTGGAGLMIMLIAFGCVAVGGVTVAARSQSSK